MIIRKGNKSHHMSVSTPPFEVCGAFCPLLAPKELHLAGCQQLFHCSRKLFGSLFCWLLVIVYPSLRCWKASRWFLLNLV